MHKFIAIKSLHVSLLLEQTCVFVKIKMVPEVIASAKQDLNNWKLSLLQYSRSRAVHRVV